MQVSGINSVNFQAKTKNDNDYKKSYIGTASMIATAAAIDAAPHIFKNNKAVQTMKTLLSCEDLFTETLPSLFKKKVPAKMVKPLKAAGIAFDLWFGYSIGKWIDDKINAKRAQKADEKAQAVDNQ